MQGISSVQISKNIINRHIVKLEDIRAYIQRRQWNWLRDLQSLASFLIHLRVHGRTLQVRQSIFDL